MNREHLRAFLWLRWRLSVNQWRRGGSLNAILMMILAIGAVVLAVPLFFGSLALGLYAFPKATAAHLMYTWDGIVVAFTFFWMIGLITELQRTEPLSLAKFLHLPVSVNGAFVINYVSSLMRLSVIIFVPVLAGLALAVVFARGWLLVSVLPLTLAFLLLVTALSYQFQGWLAALMSNPRRRRTVVVITTAVFVLIFQLPNLLRVGGTWPKDGQSDETRQIAAEMSEALRAYQDQQIDTQEYARRQGELAEKYQLAREEDDRRTAEQLLKTTRLVNLAVPLGWLPLGVLYAAEGNVLPAILGTLAMGLIGSASLWRAYRTTIGMYRGQATAKVRAPAPTKPAAATSTSAARSRGRLMEMHLPGLSEPASAIALGSFRSLVRSPESKMMLLTPIILGAVFGSSILRMDENSPAALRALLGVGAIVMSLFGGMQLMANQFGFDRDGFRTYVLCSAPRRDILLGKNLAFAPLILTLAALLLAILQVVRPMNWDHLLSMVPQAISMYLLFCLLMNLLSIFAPMHIAAGSMKPSTVKLVPMLLQMAMIMVFLPLTQSPTLLPLGIELVLESLGWTARVPVCLLLSTLLCVGVVFFYRWTLTWEGDLLRSREQRILDTVTNRDA